MNDNEKRIDQDSYKKALYLGDQEVLDSVGIMLENKYGAETQEQMIDAASEQYRIDRMMGSK